MAGPQLPIEVPYPEQDQATGWSDNTNNGENAGKRLSQTQRGRGRKTLTGQGGQPQQGWMRRNEDA